MFENANLTELKERGLVGAIACTSTGSVIDATNDELDVFGSILSYISQVADMIGEPFGMDSIEEVHLISSNATAICIPQEGDCLGVLCSSRANIDEILNELLD
ncbi:hypothetical protein QEH59_13665 [Coraliomargarita sp. SDUM461004]|uniref:Roadblock/LAMTOR2 domain-containing protein n=1 Tax=Thalassobacterium sedimentorum TaxID=3041258 RepID=A0ABU1AKY1_9BACT|nr:hypothetical protein [Coraliomargarita sp. SDUM461004]MDQ8195477.1 hypothetical protein [Coraliomargarita sp. SDUM461004]